MLLSWDLTEFLLEVSSDPAGLGDAGPEVNESSQKTNENKEKTPAFASTK